MSWRVAAKKWPRCEQCVIMWDDLERVGGKTSFSTCEKNDRNNQHLENLLILGRRTIMIGRGGDVCTCT